MVVRCVSGMCLSSQKLELLKLLIEGWGKSYKNGQVSNEEVHEHEREGTWGQLWSCGMSETKWIKMVWACKKDTRGTNG